MKCFFLWNVLLFFNSFLILKKIFKKGNFTSFLLRFLTLYYSQIAIVFIILGTIHILSPLYITVSLFSIFLILIFIQKDIRIDLKFTQFPLGNCMLLVFLFSAYAVSIYYHSFLPPLTTDGLLYHLPFAIHYYKTHSLSLPPIFFSDIAMTYYPFVGDIFYLFTIFSGQENLLNFVQMPFVVIGALSVYLLMRKNNFSENLSVLGACIFSLLRPVFKESTLSFVDLIMASTFLSALYFFSSEKKENIIFGFLSSGILIGTKNFAIIYFLFLLPVLFRNFKKEFTGTLSLGTFLFLLIGAGGYLRNIILTKNPFFPAIISIGKFTIFPGIYTYLKGNLFTNIKDVFLLFLKPVSQTDPSGLISILLFSFLFFSIITSKNEKFYLKYILFLPILLFLSYCLIIPRYYYQIRHLLPIYGSISIGLLYPFKKLERYFWLPSFFLLLVLLNSIGTCGILIQIFILSSITEILLMFSYKIGKTKDFFLFLGVIFIIFFLWHFATLKKEYHVLKYEIWKNFYKGEGQLWEFVQKNSAGGKNIAYVGSFLLYPLYGNNYQNNVYYQSVNSIRTKLIHLYPRKKIYFPSQTPEVLYREDPCFDIWLEGLKRKNTDWIVIKKGKNFIEKKWIDKNPHSFTLIFSNDYAQIYCLSY